MPAVWLRVCGLPQAVLIGWSGGWWPVATAAAHPVVVLLSKLGASGLLGYCTGYALKRVGKV